MSTICSTVILKPNRRLVGIMYLTSILLRSTCGILADSNGKYVTRNKNDADFDF